MDSNEVKLMAEKMRHDEVKFKTTILSMHQVIASYKNIIRELLLHQEGKHTITSEDLERLKKAYITEHEPV